MSSATLARASDFGPAVQGSTLAFLARPYVFFLGLFLATMVALTVDVPIVHNAAMRLRWPILGLAAFFGALQVAAHGLRRLHPASAALALVILAAAFSAAWSLDPSYSAQRAASLGLLWAATMLGVTAYARTRENVAAVFDMLWWLGAAVVLGGFLFRMGEMGPGGRYVGLHDRATGAGTYAALFLPVAIYQVRYRFRGAASFLGWGVVVALSIQLLLAGARMAMASSALIGLALGFAYFGRRALLAVVALALVLPVPLLLDQRAANRFQERSEKFLRTKTISTFTGRLDRWRFGLEKFAERPLYGYGFGVSRTLAGRDEPWRFNLTPGEVFNLHSDQIEVLMDLGLLGYAPFALFWGLLGVAGLAAVRGRRIDPEARLRAMAMLGASAYAFGDTFMHGGFLAAGGGVAPFSWTMIAVFLALSAAPSEPQALDFVDGGDFADLRESAASARSRRPPQRRPPRDGLPSVRHVLAGG